VLYPRSRANIFKRAVRPSPGSNAVTVGRVRVAHDEYGAIAPDRQPFTLAVADSGEQFAATTTPTASTASTASDSFK